MATSVSEQFCDIYNDKSHCYQAESRLFCCRLPQPAKRAPRSSSADDGGDGRRLHGGRPPRGGDKPRGGHSAPGAAVVVAAGRAGAVAGCAAGVAAVAAGSVVRSVVVAASSQVVLMRHSC